MARGAHRRAAHVPRGWLDRALHRAPLRLADAHLPHASAARLRHARYHPRLQRSAALTRRKESMATLKDRTLFITGASRGIGREIALRAARDGARIVVAAKTADPHPKLAGTIHTVAAEIEAPGGKALAIHLDVRDADPIAQARRR